MGVHEGRGHLAEVTKQLLRQWDQTRFVWKDSVAEEFERNFIRPMELDARSALAAMDRMSTMLSRIRQDCR